MKLVRIHVQNEEENYHFYLRLPFTSTIKQVEDATKRFVKISKTLECRFWDATKYIQALAKVGITAEELEFDIEV